ncbi:MAG: DMT family transporter [Bdellovibrionota bacterium]
MSIKKSPVFYPLILLCLLGCTWGTSFSIAKYAMQSGITPLGYSFWQSVGPAILISCVVLLKEKKIPLSINHLLFYIVCGLIGICLPNLSMYFSAPHLDSGLLGLVVNTSPIMTYGFSILFIIEKFRPVRFSGICIGFLGLLLLFLPKLNYPAQWHWLLFALSTPFLLSLCTIFMVKARPKNSSSLSLSAGMLIAAAVMIIPVTLNAHQFHPLTTFNLPNLFIVIEILLSSLGYILFFELLKTAGPVYYSLVGCVVALVGLLWGAIIFKETPTSLEWIAVTLILGAIFLVSFVPATKLQTSSSPSTL